ncbi:unnamed protein product, partial [Citrullus colocynthis]
MDEIMKTDVAIDKTHLEDSTITSNKLDEIDSAFKDLQHNEKKIEATIDELKANINLFFPEQTKHEVVPSTFSSLPLATTVFPPRPQLSLSLDLFKFVLNHRPPPVLLSRSTAGRRCSRCSHHCLVVSAVSVAAFVVTHELSSEAVRFHRSVTVVAAIRGTLLLPDFVLGRFGWIF